jgi:hypothetical protein
VHEYAPPFDLWVTLATMHLRAMQADGAITNVLIDEEDPSVAALKEHVAREMQVQQVDRIRLFYQGKELVRHEDTLHASGIQEGAIVHVHVRPEGFAPPNSQAFPIAGQAPLIQHHQGEYDPLTLTFKYSRLLMFFSLVDFVKN